MTYNKTLVAFCVPKRNIQYRARQTDRQTDRILITRPRLHAVQRGKNQCKKTSQFITQCKVDITHAFKTAKVTVFDPMMCKIPDVPLQDDDVLISSCDMWLT